MNAIPIYKNIPKQQHNTYQIPCIREAVRREQSNPVEDAIQENTIILGFKENDF